ncbi:MAG TPA: 50S ribosomal protein L9 [Anaerolineaceae bacterium]|nr:50S ribosomal protein L9 [Anaerolineaceae bacterium]
MKVLLLKDVYKLGRAGDIKKVANGYGRNFLIPQGFAIPATPNSIKMAESIGKKASERRAVLNNELKGVADLLQGLELRFPVKAGETGKLYGSVSAQMIIDKIKEIKDIEIVRHQLVMEPIRNLGEFDIPVNLTLDLVPEIKVIIHREGEVRKAVVPEPVIIPEPVKEVVAEETSVEEDATEA